MKKKIIVIVAMCAIILAQFNIDVYADDVFDLDDYVGVSDLPANELDAMGHVISGSFITHNAQNNNNGFNFTTFNKSASPGFVYITRDSGNYGYNYNYHIYLNGDWYGSTPTEYYAYTKTFTDSEISSSSDVETMFSDVVDDPNYRWNYPNIHYAFYADDMITNIPMFNHSDTASITAYQQTGDWSGALNSEDIVPKPAVPSPYGLQMSASGKTKDLGSVDVIFDWHCGSNETYTSYNQLAYRGSLTLNYVVDCKTILQASDGDAALYYGHVEIPLNYTEYGGSDASYRFSKDNIWYDFSLGINNVSMQIGEFPAISLNMDIFKAYGYFTSAVFVVENVAKDDHSNISPSTNYTYNYLTGEESTNRKDNTVEESPSSDNPNVSGPVTPGSGSSSANASAGSASASATGGTTNNNNTNTNNNDPTFTNNNDPTFTNNPSFTNNPTYEGNSVTNTPTYNGNTVTVTNSKGFWDLIATLLDSEREDKEDIVDGIVSTVKAIPGLLDTLNTFIGGQTAEGDDHPTGGINGLLENLQGTANAFGTAYTTLITGITSVVTAVGGLVNTAVGAVNNLISSVNGLLSTGSEFGQYITSGFGLLGENGYLAMFGAFFQFLPAEVLTMIKAAVAASCSLMLSKSAISVLKR